MTDDEHQEETESAPPTHGQTTEGAKQGDNPGVEEIEGTGGEGDDQGGLGERTGGAGGAEPTEPGGRPTGELRK
ncbi:MAG: hypothetical protein M3383_05320 [Actinomycetota bacterium]|nr:hypothetical protein [Actinomycetota bacterium]